MVWQSTVDGVRLSILANHYVPGSGWQGAEFVENDQLAHSQLVSLATDGHGSAIAAWMTARDGEYGVVANRYARGAGWGQAVPIYDGIVADRPSTAMNRDGHALVAWATRDSQTVVANWYVPGSGWGTARPVDPAGGALRPPSPIVQPLGAGLVVWARGDVTSADIVSSRYR